MINAVSAQNLTAEEASISVNVVMDGQNYYEFISYANNTGTDMEVKWERISNDIPAGWLSFICIEGGSCYAPNQGESPESEVFIIPAGESRWVEVQFRATEAEGAVPGVGTVNIQVSDESNLAVNASADYIGTAYSLPVDDIDVENIRIYPNPASDYIKISNPEGIETMELYNLIGKKVKTFDVGSSNSTFNISNLPKGMYLIRLLDDDSDVLTTKRISKR